jgi:hypothetical protein
MPRLGVRRAENRRRMDRGKDESRERRRDELAAARGDPELTPEERLRGRRTEADDRTRLHERDFRVEPRAARADFVRVRFLVNAPLAARLPFEMLDDVRDVDAPAVDAGFDERAVEEFPGRAHEWMPAQILFVPRLLADQHQLRRRRAFTENGLGPALP